MKKTLTGILILAIISTALVGCSWPFSKKEQNEEVHTDDKLTDSIEDGEDSVCELEVIPEEKDEEVEEEEADILDDEEEEEKGEKEEEEEEEKGEETETRHTTLPYKLEVDVTNQIVTAYGRDNSGNYTKVVKQMICTTGTSATPTPLGTFKMPGEKGRWGYFTKFGVYAQYWNRIRGSILFHSVLFQKPDVSTISMTSVNNLGRPASHGCVRLTVSDAKWIYDNCPAGTEVAVVQKKKNSGLTNRVKASAPSYAMVKLALSSSTTSVEASRQQNMVLNATYDNGKIVNKAKEAKWSVANTKIATIKGGVLTGHKAGTTSFTASFGGRSVKGTIKVTSPSKPKPDPKPEPKPEPKPTLTLSDKAITLKIGNSKDVKLFYRADNGAKEQLVNDKATWTSSNDNIARVSNGKITARAEGKATITARHNGLTATMEVTVPAPPAPSVEKLHLTPDNISVQAGEKTRITLKAIYDNGNEIDITKKAKWEFTKAGIATIDGSEIKGLKEGTTEFKATFGGKKVIGTITVTPNEPEEEPKDESKDDASTSGTNNKDKTEE